MAAAYEGTDALLYSQSPFECPSLLSTIVLTSAFNLNAPGFQGKTFPLSAHLRLTEVNCGRAPWGVVFLGTPRLYRTGVSEGGGMCIKSYQTVYLAPETISNV